MFMSSSIIIYFLHTRQKQIDRLFVKVDTIGYRLCIQLDRVNQHVRIC
jgi:hypothetical protein